MEKGRQGAQNEGRHNILQRWWGCGCFVIHLWRQSVSIIKAQRKDPTYYNLHIKRCQYKFKLRKGRVRCGEVPDAPSLLAQTLISSKKMGGYAERFSELYFLKYFLDIYDIRIFRPLPLGSTSKSSIVEVTNEMTTVESHSGTHLS